MPLPMLLDMDRSDLLSDAPSPNQTSLKECNDWAESLCGLSRERVSAIGTALAGMCPKKDKAECVPLLHHLADIGLEMKYLADYIASCSAICKKREWEERITEEVERAIDVRYQAIHVARRCQGVLATCVRVRGDSSACRDPEIFLRNYFTRGVFDPSEFFCPDTTTLRLQQSSDE